MHRSDWPRAGAGFDADGETLPSPDGGADGGLAARLAGLPDGHPSGPAAGEDDLAETGEAVSDQDDAEVPPDGGDRRTARPATGRAEPAAHRGGYRPWFTGDGAADPWFAAGSRARG